MKPTGVNMTDVKQYNRAYVLRLLLSRGAMSRTDLANELNLTTATLTSICRDFIQKGLLIQAEAEEVHNSGRKKYPLAINPSYRYVIAVSLHYTGHIIAITDLMGNAVAVENLKADPECDAEAFFREIANLCVRMLWQHGIASDQVLGMGVCIIGPVDENKGVALNPFKTFRERDLPIQAMLERELPFPVCVENNVCSYLTAEILYGSASENNIMAVKWGPGVGSASSINGIICKDRNYHSAEIGHTYYYRDSQALCKCGHYGCLETGVSITAISDFVHEAAAHSLALAGMVDRVGLPSIENIAEYLALDDAALKEMLDRCARDLAIGVSNAAQVFSPDQIVLYGALFESDFLRQRFMYYIRNVNPYCNENIFVNSSLEASREFIGPIATAVKRFLIETGGEVAGDSAAPAGAKLGRAL